MADYEVDRWAMTRCRELIERYPEEFEHIDPDEVLVVKDTTSDTSSRYADTSLVPRHFWPVLSHRVLIRTVDALMEPLHGHARTLVLYHELRHVAEGKDGGYKLTRHDVEDFSDMLAQYGIGWTKRVDLPDLLAR